MQKGHGGIEAERQDQEEKAVEEEEGPRRYWSGWNFHDGYSLISTFESVAITFVALFCMFLRTYPAKREMYASTLSSL